MGYIGHVNDADTGLVYMQQRYYDPVAGRFLSVDPVVSDPQSGVGFNRFAYADGSPMSGVDPTGMYTCSGSASDCRNVDDYVEKIREARERSDEGSDEREKIDRLLKVLGRKGEDTGVEFFPLELQGRIGGGATRDGRIFLDTNKLEASALMNYRRLNSQEASGKSNNDLVTEVGATWVAHEIRHLIQYFKIGYPASRAAEYANELNAYRAQVAVERALGLQGVHMRSMSADQLNTAISLMAEKSTNQWCNANRGVCK